MAEIAFDFQHQARRPKLRVRGLPTKKLLRERAHTGGCLPGSYGPDDRHSGKKAPLGNHEPFWPENLPRLERRVNLADD